MMVPVKGTPIICEDRGAINHESLCLWNYAIELYQCAHQWAFFALLLAGCSGFIRAGVTPVLCWWHTSAKASKSE